jgi:hypothetical protein
VSFDDEFSEELEIMAALFSTGPETTPSSDLREAGSSPRGVRTRLAAMLLGMSVLLLLAGGMLLESAAGLQPSHAVPGAWPEGVNAAQDPTQVWRASAAKLPREWTWERPAIGFETMFRGPR